MSTAPDNGTCLDGGSFSTSMTSNTKCIPCRCLEIDVETLTFVVLPVAKVEIGHGAWAGDCHVGVNVFHRKSPFSVVVHCVSHR